MKEAGRWKSLDQEEARPEGTHLFTELPGHRKSSLVPGIPVLLTIPLEHLGFLVLSLRYPPTAPPTHTHLTAPVREMPLQRCLKGTLSLGCRREGEEILL